MFMAFSAGNWKIQAEMCTSLQGLVQHLGLNESKSKPATRQRMCGEYKLFSWSPQKWQGGVSVAWEGPWESLKDKTESREKSANDRKTEKPTPSVFITP